MNDYEEETEMIQVGTADPLRHMAERAHTYCSVDCDCGHWRGGRYATPRPDGRRGKVTLDTIEGNGDGSR